EDECGEIDLACEFDEPIERRDTRVEDRRPRLDLGDVVEPSDDRLQQLLLLPRRPQEDSRLHPSIRLLNLGPRWNAAFAHRRIACSNADSRPMKFLDRRMSWIPQPWRTIVDWLLTIAVAVAFVLAFEAEVSKPYRIPSSSMEPTLHCAK